MEHVFYALAVIFMVWELSLIVAPSTLTNAKEINQRKKNGDDVSDEESTLVTGLGCFALIYLIWNLIGLFSSQFIFFIALLVLGLIVAGAKRLFGAYTFITIIDSLITLGILIAMVIDKYHINII